MHDRKGRILFCVCGGIAASVKYDNGRFGRDGVARGIGDVVALSVHNGVPRGACIAAGPSEIAEFSLGCDTWLVGVWAFPGWDKFKLNWVGVRVRRGNRAVGTAGRCRQRAG